MNKRKIVTKRILALFTVFTFMGLHSLFAQSLEQSIFDQIQQRTGSSTQATQVRSPLDQSREQDYLNNLYMQLEERRKAGPSVIEQDFMARKNSITGNDKGELTQFGYSLFDRLPPMGQILTGTIPDSYVLGVGDEFTISFKGSREEIVSVKVDREGRLIVPGLKPIMVAGLTFGEVKGTLGQRVSESLIGTEVYASIATLRQISVLVAGEVENPTLVRTTSLASPIEVLLHVGGVKKTGSLRNITLLRGDQKIAVDLYKVVDGTNAEIIYLRDGDRLIVPTIGATVALDGNVIRPGIYELPNGMNQISSRDALKLAGGTIRAQGNSMTHLRYDETGKAHFEKLDLSGTLKSGEMVIVNLLENSEVGKVTLIGHVKIPGVRSVGVYGTVRDLIGSVKNLTVNPYLLFGVIERTHPLTQARQLIPFSPQEILYGEKNITLQDEDRVVVLGHEDIQFLKSDAIRQAIFSSEYLEEEFLEEDKPNRKYCKTVANLAKIIADTQSDRFATATRAVFVRQESVREQGDTRESMLDEDELSAIEQQRLALANLQTAPQTSMMRQDEEDEEEEEEEEDFEFCPSVYQEVDNLLPFTLEHIISIDGAVRLPGVFPISGETSADLLLSVAGGTTNDANLTRIEVTSRQGEANSGNLMMNWEYIDGSVADLKGVKIYPGGGVRVSSVYTNFESGAVLLSGEFVQPGVYTIRKGEKLSSLIERAGGLTDQAYPYGAIFTRDRVKDIQRQEMRQTAQRLQSAMVSASVKKNIDANGAIALQRLVNQMAEQNFIGRVVIESDPVVLALDPNKDIVLEAGDSLYMPKRPNFIVTVGDVLNPSALQFVPGKGVSSYLDEVGGFSQSADEDRVFVVYPNGVAKPIKLSSWGGDRNMSIPPGSAIVVPTDLSPYDNLTLISTISSIFSDLAVSSASIAILFRN